MRQSLSSIVDLHVYVSFWIDPRSDRDTLNRKFSFLANSILEISRIQTVSTNVHVFTNFTTPIWRQLSAPLANLQQNTFEIHHVTRENLTVEEDSVYVPWLLTWQHKKQMRKDILAGGERSVFLYLEDDAIFTEQNLQYFLTYRLVLNKVGLIPGFVRAEWSDVHHQWIHPDSFSDDANEPLFRISDHKEYFHQRKNPYSALIILDKQLGLEYIKSDSFKQEEAWKKHPIIYDVGSTAALGLIAENIPEGYINRMASPVANETFSPLVGSVVRHQGNKYANDIWQRHYRLFGKNAGDRILFSRTFWNYLGRILRKDSIFIVTRVLKERFRQEKR